MAANRSKGRIKKLMGVELDKHLETGHLEKWQHPLRASERRILLTQWLANAWHRIDNSEYPGGRRKLFERTGLLMTTDGGDDDLVQPKGFADYLFKLRTLIKKS